MVEHVGEKLKYWDHFFKTVFEIFPFKEEKYFLNSSRKRDEQSEVGFVFLVKLYIGFRCFGIFLSKYETKILAN